jgi:hypothetical protein
MIELSLAQPMNRPTNQRCEPALKLAERVTIQRIE